MSEHQASSIFAPIGSIGLFFGLAIVMYLTRNVDWHSGKQE